MRAGCSWAAGPAQAIDAVGIGSSAEDWDGEIAEDDSSPPPGRVPPVRYTSGLFSDDEDCSSPEAMLGAGNMEALIAHLESMAAQLEAELGEPETEIRQKIADLQSCALCLKHAPSKCDNRWRAWPPPRAQTRLSTTVLMHARSEYAARALPRSSRISSGSTSCCMTATRGRCSAARRTFGCPLYSR